MLNESDADVVHWDDHSKKSQELGHCVRVRLIT